MSKTFTTDVKIIFYNNLFKIAHIIEIMGTTIKFIGFENLPGIPVQDLTGIVEDLSILEKLSYQSEVVPDVSEFNREIEVHHRLSGLVYRVVDFNEQVYVRRHYSIKQINELKKSV